MADTESAAARRSRGIEVPDELAAHVLEVAEKLGVSVEDLIAFALFKPTSGGWARLRREIVRRGRRAG
jgi:hypothetical protein